MQLVQEPVLIMFVLYSEKKFTLTTPDDVINGVGFESKKDLSKFLAKQMSSQHTLKEN